MVYATRYHSPIGELLLAEQNGALVGLWIEGQKYFLGSVDQKFILRETPILSQAKEWLTRYFAGDQPEIKELQLAPLGSRFRQTVWEILCRIPYGQVSTYGEIAKEMAVRLGRDAMSAQAVGGAVGHNPISIIIPCHRVVGSSGSLTGYAGGIATKVKLLTHEGVDLSEFFVPKRGTAL
ncbi:MAG: methylated-DNA--[protein]-cysteine S-methyltransferase [Candidatus Pararuminococcus gallinarum]|jgi:methylated-DNA-[protein]-cysteine S-methyltransferase